MKQKSCRSLVLIAVSLMSLSGCTLWETSSVASSSASSKVGSDGANLYFGGQFQDPQTAAAYFKAHGSVDMSGNYWTTDNEAYKTCYDPIEEIYESNYAFSYTDEDGAFHTEEVYAAFAFGKSMKNSYFGGHYEMAGSDNTTLYHLDITYYGPTFKDCPHFDFNGFTTKRTTYVKGPKKSQEEIAISLESALQGAMVYTNFALKKIDSHFTVW